MTRFNHQFLVASVFAAFSTAAALPVLAENAYTTEFPAETAALVAATSEFFDQVQAESDVRPRKSLVIEVPDLASKASFEGTENAEPMKLHGPLRHLTGYRINWYPTDRFLGSVDFMGTWDGNRNLVCGYLIWDLGDPSNPVLETVTANYVELGELVGASPAEVHEALLEANCAYGAIEANYGFFEIEG